MAAGRPLPSQRMAASCSRFLRPLQGAFLIPPDLPVVTDEGRDVSRSIEFSPDPQKFSWESMIMLRTVAQYRRQSLLTRRAAPRVEPLETRSLLSTGYSFAPVASLGDPVTGLAGGTFADDFEAGGLNNKGQVAFVADLANGQGDHIGEGVFLGDSRGSPSKVVLPGESAPGGGTFLSLEGTGGLSPIAINGSGDVAFGFLLSPFTSPFGNNAGVYRYSHTTHQVTAVVVPGVTPVPGGRQVKPLREPSSGPT
jgi:hypothetical protein